MKQEAKYAGFWVRAIADFIDSILLDIASLLFELMALGLVYWVRLLAHSVPPGASFFEFFDPFILQVIFFVLRGALSLGYYGWGTYRYGTTLGKKVFEIYLVDFKKHAPLTKKQSLIRCLAYLVSYFPLGAGFLMVAFHPEKRALHDLIAGTVSIYRRKKGE